MRIALGFYSDSSSIIATVEAFRLGEFRNQEHFVELVRSRIGSDMPAPRYHEIQQSARYEEIGDYRCVRHTAVYEDQDSRTVNGTQNLDLKQEHALYCLYPDQDGMGFVARYSYRGTELPLGFDREAWILTQNFRLLPQTPGAVSRIVVGNASK